MPVCVHGPVDDRTIDSLDSTPRETNCLYGFRTWKTLSDERIWFEANAYAGRLFLRLGIVYVIAALVLCPAFGEHFVAYNVTCAVIVLGGLLIVTLLSLRHLRSL